MQHATPGGPAAAPKPDWKALARELGSQIAPRAADHDESDKFVAENFALLRERRVFSAAVPAELGGGGCSHREMCDFLRELATYCSSTALALSMHQHLVATSIWNYRHGKPGQALLEKVAAKELILVSTGAGDWLASNGTVKAVEGGFRVSAKKPFASGSPMGDLLITSAPYEDPREGWQVLHFPVPFRTPGVRLDENWKALGMRGTGSHTVVLDDVFVPEATVTLRRPRGRFHTVWGVVLTVAMPLITSVYVGVAQAAAEIALQRARKQQEDASIPYLLGEMHNQLVTAQVALDSMIHIANNFDFEPGPGIASDILSRKTIAVRAALATAEKALETVGGAGFFRSLGLERLVRDAHGGQFHPLPEKKQQHFTGRVMLGLEPVAS